MVYIVTSYKGGVGKSTVSVNLSAGLARLGYKVLLVDLDISVRCLDLYLGCENDTVYDFYDVINKDMPLEKAVFINKRSANGGEKLHLLTSPYLADNQEKNQAAFNEFAEYAKKAYDYVIFDCPPGNFDYLETLCVLADIAIVVAAHTAVSTRAAEKSSSYLNRYGISDIRLIINCLFAREIVLGSYQGIIDMIYSSKIRLAGVIEYDKQIPLYQELGKTVYEIGSKRLSGYFDDIIDRIGGNNKNLNKKYSGIKTDKLFFRK